MNEAYITNDLVRWARERVGFSKEQLADSLRVKAEQIDAWESGNSLPAFGKAQQLANVLRIPFGYLFLPKPPAERTPLPDLRTLAEGAQHQPSPDFLDLLHDVIVKQQWYREYAEEQIHANPLSIVGRFRMSSGSAKVAADIIDVLGINDELRRQASTTDEFLRLISRNAEAAGILVMRSGIVGGNVYRKLSVSEFRGFAISDEYAPLIFINGRDAKVAQVFTLAHEVCNAVAAEVLVPGDDFARRWPGSQA